MNAPLLVPVLVLLLAVGGLMGFRDAPNAVALAVRFRALTPRVALILSALLNAVGVLLGALVLTLGLPLMVAGGTARPEVVALVGVAAAVTLGWGVLAWRFRAPTSTTHALLASLAAAHVASVSALGSGLDPAFENGARWEVAASLLLSPVLAWGLARLTARPVLRLATTGTTVNVQRRARIALAVSTGLIALGHGVQAALRLLPLAVLAATAAVGTGLPPGTELSAAFVAAAAVLAAAVGIGTLGGAWGIAWTLTERLVILDPLRAAVAAVVPAVLLFAGTLLLHLPLSSTHTGVAGIVGAGQTQSYASVRWGAVARVAVWWVATPLVCGSLAFAAGAVLLPLLG